MSRRSPLALSLAFISLALAASPSARTAPDPSPAGAARAATGLSCQTWRLDNGLTVILHEDHVRPSVVVNLWYGVGSKDESPGRSGFAHLFEHLMFMGTERAPGGEFDKIMEAGGGWNNASTEFDRTNYFSTGPSDLLPTLLWLDADRLEDLGRMMSQEKLDKQRDVVRNERRQSDENRPYGMADLAVDAEMFPLGHPYHFSVIGTHEDLQAATVPDVQQFFATFYVPSNASLVIAGDFDSAAIRPLVERLFGTLATKPVPPHGKAPPVRLDGVKRLTMTDHVQLNRVTMAWHSPPLYAEGDADLDVLANVLASGKSSRLWQRLVRDTQLCADVSAWQGSRELQSLFEIEATCPPESDLARIEAIIDEETGKLASAGPTTDEIERARNGIEHAKVGQLDSLLGIADQLNQYQHYLGKPDSLQWDLARYGKVSAASVKGWAHRVLDPQRRLVLRVLSEDPRRRPEASSSAAAFAFPQPQSWTLPNGLVVDFWERHDLPLISAALLLPAGASGDGTGRAGLTSLALDMLDEGTKSLSAEDFARALDQLGASMDSSARRETSTVTLRGLSRNFDRAFELWTEAITAPAMAAEEWQRVKSLRLDELRQRDDDPSSLAGVVATRAFFGDAHPYAWPVEGLVGTCESLDLDAVARRLPQVVRPEGATLLVAGDLDRAHLEQLVTQRLGGWAATGEPAARIRVEPRGPQPMRVVLVPRGDAVQTVVRFAWPGPDYGDADRVPLRLLNTLFGGSFTSRLNQNLRELHGYTYGASSRFSLEKTAGWATAGAAVRADVTGASLSEFQKEFEKIRSGDVSDDERAKAAATVRNEMVQSTEGLDGIVSTAGSLLAQGEPLSAFDRDFASLPSITTAQLADLAKRRIAPSEGILVLVGDESAIREQIKDLALGPITVVDSQGAPADAKR